MSKFMSVLEKFNLIEKTDEEAATISDMNDAGIQENIETNYAEEGKDEAEEQYIEPQNEYENQYTESVSAENEDPEKADTRQKKNLTIEEIYSLYNLENSAVNTVFMLGNFINALPESLPRDVRKKSIISIINSADADLNKLLDDGKKRLNALQQFSNEYSKTTTNTVDEYKEKIAGLKKLISEYEEQIRISENHMKEQNSIIKYETEKINSITSFFDNVG